MRFTVFFTLLALTAGACDDASNTSDTINEPLVLTQDSTYPNDACGPEIYPCPPYGTRQYQTVRNIPFLPANQAAQEIAGEDGIARLQYFYQLKAQGYKLLQIVATTEWCEVCERQMAITEGVVSQYGHLSDNPRVAFMAVVTEDDNLENASIEVAANYAADHDMETLLPITNDENRFFRELLTSIAYPFNIFIDLSTMEILDYDSGLETEQLYTQRLEELLDFIGKK